MARRDVEIRVRAKDDASRNAKKIADALKLIGQDGKKATSGAKETSLAFGQMAADAAKLQASLGGLKTLGTLIGQMEKAGASVGRIGQQIEQAAKGFESIRGVTAQYTQQSAELTAKIRAEEAAIASRNADLKAATALQKESKDALTALARAQDVLNGKTRKGVTAGASAATAGVGTEAGAPQTSARASFGAFLAADVTAAKAAKNQLKAVVDGLQREITASETAITEYGAQLKSVKLNEKEFAAETLKTGNALLALRTDLGAAKARLASTEEEVLKANAAMGTLALTQDDVAAAAARATAQLAQQERAIAVFEKFAGKRLTGGRGTIAEPTSEKSATAMRVAREELEILRIEQAKLDAQLRTSSGNVTGQVDAYNRMTTAVRLAEENLRKLEIAQRLVDSAGRKTGYGRWIAGYESGLARVAQADTRASAARQRSAQELAKIAAQAERTSAAKRRLAVATDQATRAQTGFGHETRTTLSFMQRIRGEVIALTTAYIGLFGAYNRVREAAIAFRAVEAAQTRLGVAFGGDLGKVQQEMAFLNAEADRLGFTFGVLAGGYSKISIAAASAGFSIRDTRQLFTAITEAARVNGSTVEDTNGILKAFEQILNKGRIQAEELTGQIGDRGLPAFKLFADALGVTTAELGNMLKAGEVFADRETLLKAADRITAVYSGQLPSALASTGFALDSFARSAEEINLLLAEGMVNAIKEASASLAAFVDSAEGKEAFRSIGEAAGVVISLLAQIPEYFDEIATVAKVLLTIGIARWANGFGGAIGGIAERVTALVRTSAGLVASTDGLTASQLKLARATATANNALLVAQSRLDGVATRSRFLVGPIRALQGVTAVLRVSFIALSAAANAVFGGIAAIAVGAVITALLTWETEADRATSALQEHERQVGLVREAYSSATGGVEDWSKALSDLTVSQANASLADLQARYAAATKEIEYYSREAIAFFSLEIDSAPEDALAKQAVELNSLAKEFSAGRLDVEYFIAAVDDIAANAADEDLRDIALGMLDLVNNTKDGSASVLDLGEAIEASKKIIGLFSEDTKEASEAALELENSLDDVNETADNTDPLTAYSDAIAALKGQIPSLAADMERLQKTTALNASAWTALVAAWNSGDFSNIKEVLRLWLQGAGDIASGGGGEISVGGGLVDRIIGVESGGNPNAKNPNSTATGLGQFIESTWLSMFKKYFPDRAAGLSDAMILELRKNAEISREMVGLYAQENAKFLRSFGAEVNDANLYLAHFLGPQGALDITRAAGSTPTSEILGQGQIDANASILEGTTAAEVIAWAQRKVGISNEELAVREELGEIDANRVEADREAVKLANERTKSTRETIADLDFQLQQQERINSGKEREAAIEAALRAARSENPTINADELARIREKTGLLFDQQNAQTGIELSEKRVNALFELRQQLIDQMQIAQDAGNVTVAEGLRVEIEGLNGQLQTAILNAKAMWMAIGGPDAELAIAKLNTMSMSINASRQQVGGLGLSMDTWYGVFQSAVQGIVGAFDSFAQAVANGENAFSAFGKSVLQTLASVLQQIAAAIIQMQILKLLQGFGGSIGGFAGQMLAGGLTGHTGGVVGSSAIGSGNRIGRPAWMQSALTYHTGGVAGFRPDEVSATLKQGEEVLTEEDPRHRFNMGGKSSSGSGERLTQVLAIGEKQVQEMMNRYGKDAVLTHIKSEAPTIRRMLGV